MVDYHNKSKACYTVTDERMNIYGAYVLNLLWLKLFFSLIFRVKEKPDVIVASGDCYIGLFAFFLAKLSGCKFVFDIYDRYDQFSGYRRLFFIDLQRFLRARADACFFASATVPEMLGGKITTDVIVPNGIDRKHFRPLDKQDSRESLVLPSSDIIIGYFGSMELDRGVEDLIDAIELIRQKDISYKLLLAGSNTASIDLESSAVIYLGNVGYKEMPQLLACCDVLALPYRRSEVMDAGASNKILEYLACERPIAATRTPNLLNNFVAEQKFPGKLAEPGNIKELAEAIVEAVEYEEKIPMPRDMSWEDISEKSLLALKNLLVDRKNI